jgi:hypothetical protein
MSEYVYTVKCSLDVGKAVDSVGSLLRELNDALAKSGVQEQLTVRAPWFRIMLTCNRRLTRMEVTKVRQMMQEDLTKHLGRYAIRIDSIRGQSRSQSQSR